MESLLVGVGDNPPADPSQEGETGDNPPLAPRRGGEDRRNGNYRGGSRKNCKSDFFAIIIPKY
ncbi:MAG: hypothetical protein F6K48_30240 [Okeania sp. SIO3H1]|uniref:hypothetical protein n=1 Tax=Okeania sp. SIO1I7 TaxID=2607772 RepID=UPI0013C74675|nr:hypothetical protein [Okeania sp. SIO1I7]NEN92942.1 hypothetical protein [Okeania sp. SIO3H1]NET28564.1 hypothetical protein [Okeania sp. SIO1I7]